MLCIDLCDYLFAKIRRRSERTREMIYVAALGVTLKTVIFEATRCSSPIFTGHTSSRELTKDSLVKFRRLADAVKVRKVCNCSGMREIASIGFCLICWSFIVRRRPLRIQRSRLCFHRTISCNSWSPLPAGTFFSDTPSTTLNCASNICFCSFSILSDLTCSNVLMLFVQASRLALQFSFWKDSRTLLSLLRLVSTDSFLRHRTKSLAR